MGAFIQLYGGQMLTIVGTLLGTWAGYRLRASDERKDKRRRIRATWGAISAEVEACKRMATEYLRPTGNGHRVAAPQWRLPNVMLTSSLRALLADGDPSEPEVDALLKYHTEVETLNRGLDLAQEAGTSLLDLSSRMWVNDLKAQRLAEGGEYYAALRPLIDRHV